MIILKWWWVGELLALDKSHLVFTVISIRVVDKIFLFYLGLLHFHIILFLRFTSFVFRDFLPCICSTEKAEKTEERISIQKGDS